MGRGRAPCCDKSKVKKGPWSPAEDLSLITFIQKNGHPNWRSLPRQAGLQRCGKSCRLRWINYLRPDVKRGNFTREEEDTIIKLHQSLGNKWSKIASHLPGRTDNEIKNVWNTHLKKRLTKQGNADQAISHHKHENSSSPSPSCSSGSSPMKVAPQEYFPKESSSSSTSITGADEMGCSADQVIEIPFELDAAAADDFWDILDSLEDPNVQGSSSSDHEHGEVECSEWLRYLENELGLDATSSDENDLIIHSHSHIHNEPTDTDGPMISPELVLDHGKCYFEMWPSPPTPSLGI